MSDSNKSHWLVRALGPVGNLIITCIALLVFAFREPAVYLHDKVYRGFWGGCRGFLGLAFAFGTSYQVGHYLGWTLDYPTMGWLSAAIASWFGVLFYAWPAIYHFVVRNAWKLIDRLMKGVEKLIRNYSKKFFDGVVGVVAYLPGSRRAWNVVLDEKRRNWSTNLLAFGAWLGITAGSAYLGWQTFACVSALTAFGIPAVAYFAAGIFAGLLVFGMVEGTLCLLVYHGWNSFLSIAGGAGLAYLYSAELTGLGTLIGLSGPVALVMLPLAAILFVAYVYPYATWILSGDLVKKIIDGIEKLNDACYGDKNTGYTKFLAHTLNFAATAAIGYGAFYVCGLVGLSAWGLPGLEWVGMAGAVVVTAVATLLGYLLAFDILFEKHSRFGKMAFLASIAVGWKTMSLWVAAELAGGYWLGVPAGFLAALVFGGILVPLVYLAIRFVLLIVRADLAGEPLDKAYKFVETKVKKFGEVLDKVYEVSYRDRTGYQSWFLNASNIAVSVWLGFQTSALCAWLGFGAVLSWVFIVPVVVLAYILIGKFLHKSTVGTEFLGGSTSLAVAIWVGAALYGAGLAWYVYLPISLVFACLNGFILFPLAYLAAKLVLKPVLASWSATPLAWLHGKAWDAFKVVWDAGVAAYKAIKVKLQPVWKKIAEIWASIRESYIKISERVFGKKKKDEGKDAGKDTTPNKVEGLKDQNKE
jgi:hypothetical protein